MKDGQCFGIKDEDIVILSTAQKPSVSRHSEGAVVILGKGKKPQWTNQADYTESPEDYCYRSRPLSCMPEDKTSTSSALKLPLAMQRWGNGISPAPLH